MVGPDGDGLDGFPPDPLAPPATDPADPYRQADPFEGDPYESADPYRHADDGRGAYERPDPYHTSDPFRTSGSFRTSDRPVADPYRTSDPFRTSGSYDRYQAPEAFDELDGYGGQPAYEVPYRETGRARTGTSRGRSRLGALWPLMVLGLVAVVAIAVGVNLIFRALDDGEGEAVGSTAATIVADSSSTTSSTVPPESTSTPTAGVGDPTIVVTVPDSGPYVAADFDGELLQVSGTVPDEATLAAIIGTAQAAYLPERVQSTVVVDPAVGPAQPWLAGAPEAVALLQIADQGSMVIAESGVAMTGEAKSAEDVEFLEGQLAASTGLPVATGSFEITDLRPPVYVLAVSDGMIVLSGSLPTEELRLGFVEVAGAIYGPENVVDASTVDEGVATALWMRDPEALLGTVAAFSTYEIRFEGDGIISELSGGPTFEPGSSEISPELAGVLNFGILAMLREPRMVQIIRGHTDSTGPDELNLELSQQRADAAKAYLVAAGIAPERVTAIGVGEAEPVAPNDTAEGRAQNRRIEIIVESQAGLGGP